VSSEALRALLGKYVEMRRLREEDAAGGGGDPRPAMKALAAEFPGALREIDELPLAVIDARLGAIERAIAGGTVETWMLALARYHELLRIALGVRRVVGDDRSLERARGVAGAQVLDDAALRAILRPPGGRINRAIFAIVAGELGSSADEIEALLVHRRRDQ
jgi:hypothetical protein